MCFVASLLLCVVIFLLLQNGVKLDMHTHVLITFILH